MKAEAKIKRMRQALAHQEADQIPVGEFFWTGFMKKCIAKWGPGFDIYRHFDLDYIVITPNMDPKIQAFEILEEKGEDIRLKTGFGATIKRSGTAPMPHFDAFSVEEPEDMAQFEFDRPDDARRYFSDGDDQLNGVGDQLVFNTPAWRGRVDRYKDDFAVFGSVCEVYEYLWRVVGTENALVWMMTEPELMEDFTRRIGKFLLGVAKAQIEAGAGDLSGMYIWGDVAYRNGMLISPELWRKFFKPYTKALIDLCHANGLMVIYHGCGNATKIYEDMIEIGLDAYNPLEAKADLDVVKLKDTYDKRLGFVGNIDVRVLETGDFAAIRREVLYKLQAGAGGGWVFQSDHSVSSEVEPESYEYAIKLLREFGKYPLDLPRIRAELN
jgi:uroporphyrinogen decarboxylase